jgi:hypothetical protein
MTVIHRNSGTILKAITMMHQTSLLALPIFAPSPRATIAPAFVATPGRPDMDRGVLEEALAAFMDGLPDEMKGVRVEEGRVGVGARCATIVSEDRQRYISEGSGCRR